MAWPDFIIIGGARCGTTALTHFLGSHPEISMPVKEPSHFVQPEGWMLPAKMYRRSCAHGQWRYQTDEAYTRMLDRHPEARIKGEASVQYLMDDRSAPRIAEKVPDVKLIALLRQPVERAYAHFNLSIMNLNESEPDFVRCIGLEPKRAAEGWRPDLQYLHCSHYVHPLKVFLQYFPREQLRIYLFEDWNQQPEKVWSELMSYLGAQSFWQPDFNLRVAPTRKTHPLWQRTKTLRQAVRQCLPRAIRLPIQRWTGKTFNQPIVALSPGLRDELTRAYFMEEILELQELLGRDLSAWLPR